jgi:DNA (cytosine-5)-methyltransferase 1
MGDAVKPRWQLLCAVDSDKWAAATFRANFPGVDVHCCTVAEAIPTLPDCDVILGGPPCQGFSLAGKGVGEKDERNGWPDFIAAVAAKMPRMLLAEVKAMKGDGK